MRNVHLKETAKELNIPKKASSGYAILCLHGRNQTPEFMVEILKRLGWDEFPIILPAASEKSWYPKGFMANAEENQPHLNYALEVVEKAHKKLNDLGYSNDRIIFMGFSQGACLIAQYALLNPDKYKSIFILTGGYIGQENINWDFDGDFQATPVYLTTSEIDEWVPAGRTKETAAEFEKMNAQVELQIFKNRPHEVSDDEIQQVRKYLI